MRLGRMPRFYLHICNGQGFVEDNEGQELANEAEAREAAIHSARDIAAADVKRGELDLASFIEVEDANHRWLFTLTFAEAIDLKGQHQTPPSTGGRRRVEH